MECQTVEEMYKFIKHKRPIICNCFFLEILIVQFLLLLSDSISTKPFVNEYKKKHWLAVAAVCRFSNQMSIAVNLSPSTSCYRPVQS